MESWSGSPLKTEVNVSRTGDVGLSVSGQGRLVLEVLMVLMCLGAVTGNILVIVIVAVNKTFHSVTSVLIMNLAVSDLLVGVGVMPFVALSIMDPGWTGWTGLCLYVGFTSSVYCTASVLSVAAIALDRYHSIMDCLRYSSHCTLRRTSAVVLWIWLQALLTSVPPLLGWSSIGFVPPVCSCVVIWSSSPGYTAFMATLSYLLPALVVCFCYVNIVKVARSHARRIHTLEDSVQRSRSPNFPPGDSSQQCCPARLIYHLNGKFVSEVRREQEGCSTSALPGSPAEGKTSTTRRLVSFFVAQSSQQHQNQHGVLRLILVISAFFLCWTPFIGVAVVEAAEAAISGRSDLIPPSVVTFSHWLLLLNSDINPLLYALLSKRFQGALQGLRQKITARLGMAAGAGDEVQAEGGDCRSSDPNTLTTIHPSPPSCSETSSSDDSRLSSSVFTVTTDFKHYSAEHGCRACQHESSLPSCSAWLRIQDRAERRMDCLQVPSRPHEGSRLPSSALTKERQATFFYGQITVRVEHDVG